MSPEGRGKSVPAVDGTTDEARAANRRVEIGFQTKVAGAGIDVGSNDAPTPEATGAEAAGTETIIASKQKQGVDQDFAVTVESVHRTGAYLVRSLRVVAESDGQSELMEFFGSAVQGLRAGRGLKNATMIAGAHNLTLLGEGGRIYPADYVIEEHSDGVRDERATLADQFLAETMEQGESVLVTVIWPDPGAIPSPSTSRTGSASETSQ